MASMKKNIERKCNKLFVSCFRPVDTARLEGGSVQKAVDRNRDVLAVVADSMEEDTTTMIKSKVSDDVFVRTRRRSRRNKFSKIVKAVLFETSLAKKIRAKKLRKNPFRSSSNASRNSEKSSIINQKSAPYNSTSDEDDDSETMTSTWSSSSSTLAEDKNVISNGAKRNQECWNYALGLVFISLLVLVFWGKFFAIFCTSSWLFFVPSRSKLHGSSGIGAGLPNLIPWNTRKGRSWKVFLEGTNVLKSARRMLGGRGV